jgi:hypothetical protein
MTLALGERKSRTWLVFVRLPYQIDDIMVDIRKHPEPKTGRETLALYQTLGRDYDLRIEPVDDIPLRR